MSRPSARVLLVAVSLLVALVVPGSVAAPSAHASSRAPAVDVSPDPAHDQWVGTGGIVVPSSEWRGTEGGRRQAASCVGCSWSVTVLCTKGAYVDGVCSSDVLGCPAGTTPTRVWLQRPGQAWTVVGRACMGPRPPVAVADIGSQVHDRAVLGAPELRPGVQPADGSLVQLPTLFRSGQPAAGVSDGDLSVLGLDVRLTSRPRWRWTFGDGTSLWTASPGGTWPITSVRHAYRRLGTMTVTVRAVWAAEYAVDGLGPFPVPGPPLVQVRSLTVVVRAAHAHVVR